VSSRSIHIAVNVRITSTVTSTSTSTSSSSFSSLFQFFNPFIMNRYLDCFYTLWAYQLLVEALKITSVEMQDLAVKFQSNLLLSVSWNY
jgi:hypothetical protein